MHRTRRTSRPPTTGCHCLRCRPKQSEGRYLCVSNRSKSRSSAAQHEQQQAQQQEQQDQQDQQQAQCFHIPSTTAFEFSPPRLKLATAASWPTTPPMLATTVATAVGLVEAEPRLSLEEQLEEFVQESPLGKTATSTAVALHLRNTSININLLLYSYMHS